MAFNRFEQSLVDQYTNTQFPDLPPEPEQSMPADGVQLAMGGNVAGRRSDAPLSDVPIALWDTLSGALRGTVAQTLGLPGDVESLVRMLTGGKQVMPTTERMGEILPPVVPPSAPGAEMRQKTAEVAGKFGEFNPIVGAPEAIKMGVKGAKAIAPMIPKNVPVGMSIKPVGDVSDALLMPVKIGERELNIPADQAAVLQKAIKNLTPAEQAKFRSDTAIKFVNILQDLPSTKEFAAAAIGGKAKKGWYEGSTQAILEVFGPDAPRFAALLSATSPQTSVESNLFNALQIWKNWTAAGRPVDRGSIVKVMGKSVQGNKGEESVLDAWINNSVAALSSDDPAKVVLSGPKVNSFMLNLQGNVNEVTNDAWMAAFSLVDQKLFAGSLTKGGDPGKGPGYLAMNARVRETATYLTKLTGETWTPAEVQETIWSWAKTLYEKAGSAGESRNAVQLIKDNAITDELIASTPDFRTLFYDQRFQPILEQSGYADQLARLREATGGIDVPAGGQKPGTGGKAGAIDPEAQRKLNERNARRLDNLRKQREQAAAAKAQEQNPTGGIE